MTQAVVVAIITGLCSLIGCVISNLTSHSKTIYRIEQLEQKQDKLIAGKNITIENNVISATGGGEDNTVKIDEIPKIGKENKI